ELVVIEVERVPKRLAAVAHHPAVEVAGFGERAPRVDRDVDHVGPDVVPAGGRIENDGADLVTRVVEHRRRVDRDGRVGRLCRLGVVACGCSYEQHERASQPHGAIVTEVAGARSISWLTDPSGIGPGTA